MAEIGADDGAWPSAFFCRGVFSGCRTMCAAFGLMQFGSLQLKSNLFLSPLAGYTNLPFRLVLREVGGLCLSHDRPRQRPVAARAQLQGTQAHRDERGRQPVRGAVVWCRAGRDARRGAVPRVDRRGLDRHQHGLPGAQGLQDRRRLSDDDRVGQDRAPREDDGQCGEVADHGQNASRLGRQKHHRARLGARARGCRRGAIFIHGRTRESRGSPGG